MRVYEYQCIYCGANAVLNNYCRECESCQPTEIPIPNPSGQSNASESQSDEPVSDQRITDGFDTGSNKASTSD